MKKCDEVRIVKENECVSDAKNAFLSVALIVGVLTIIVGICVAVYKYLTPDYLDDFVCCLHCRRLRPGKNPDTEQGGWK